MKTHRDLINDSLNRASDGAWMARHRDAWHQGRGMAAGIAGIIKGAAAYADAYRIEHESRIGEDGVLGDEWVAIVRGALGLLNGELGGLDGGTLDRLIRAMLELEGFASE